MNRQTIMRTLAGIVLGLSMLMLYVPFSSIMPINGLDPSWALSMNELAARDAVFGREVVFTYGPLAAVQTVFYHPATDLAVIGTSLALAVAVVMSWCFILRGRAPSLWWSVALILWLGISWRESLLFAVPMLVSMATVCWVIDDDAARRQRASRGRPGAAVWLLLIFGWGVVGVLPLIKGTLLVLSSALAMSTAIYLLARSRPLPAFLVLSMPAAVSVAVWCATGQTLTLLPEYLGSMFEIIRGYTEAMAAWPHSDHQQALVFLYLGLAALLLFNAIRFGARHGITTSAFLLSVFSVSLFLSFKAAFVRHDIAHILAAMNVGLILACVAWVRFEMSAISRRSCIAVSGLLWFAMMSSFPGWSIKKHLPHWWEAQRAAMVGLSDRVFQPTALHGEFQDAFAKIRKANPLPALAGEMDVYSTRQAEVFANGLNWRPRPVLQSYSAYTPELARMNRAHLLGSDAPDWLWFSVEPIDGRLAAQEDGESWPALLNRYEPVGKVQDGLILKRRHSVADESTSEWQVRKSTQKDAELGERIALPDGSGPVMLRIQIERNLLGRFMHLAFKSTSLVLEVETNNGETRRLRVISSLLAQGVLLSPLIESTEDFALLFGEDDLLTDKRVTAIRLLEVERGHSHWRKRYTLTFSETALPPKQPLAMRQALSLQQLQPFDATTALPEVTCEGSIDWLNAIPQGSAHVQYGGLLRVRGWMVHKDSSGPQVTQPLLVVKSAGGKIWKMPVVGQFRPDVGKRFGNEDLAQAGWHVVGDVLSLQGPVEIQLAYEHHGQVRTCSNLAVAIERK